MIKDSIYFNIRDVLKSFKKGDFFFSYEGVLFPIFIDYKGSDKWVVFTPGRHSRVQKPTLPSFQRQSFSPEINANIISLFDPTLLTSNSLSLAWFIGNQEKHYAKIIANLLHTIFQDLNVDFSNILIYGSSGGGIPAIMIGKHLQNCTVYCCNIQTDIRKYVKKHVQSMVEEVFSSKNINHFLDLYSERICCYEWEGNFTLILTQNKCDIFHYENHFLPYLTNLNSRFTKIKYTFITYEDEESGHDVLTREIEINIINALIERKNFIDFLPRPDEIKSTKSNYFNDNLINSAKNNIYELPFKDTPKNKIDVTIKREGKKVHVSTCQNIIPLSSKPTFAYYLMYKDQKVEQRWYEEDHSVVFTLKHPNDLKNYNIIAFIRDKNNKKYKKKVNI